MRAMLAGEMEPERTTTRLPKTTLVSQAYDFIRNQITSSSLSPGERIDIRRLTEQLDISQTPVREALQKLTDQRLVVSKPYVGYFVVELSVDDVRELYQLRLMLESFSIRLSRPRMQQRELEELLAEIRQVELIEDDLDLAEHGRRIEKELHWDLILGRTRNRWFERIRGSLIDNFELLWHLPGNPRTALAFHRQIVEQLLSGETEVAAETLAAHLDAGMKRAVAAIQHSQSFT